MPAEHKAGLGSGYPLSIYWRPAAAVGPKMVDARRVGAHIELS